MGSISLGTILVAAVLIILVGAIVFSMVRKKRAGKNILCSGCDCSKKCNGSCGLTDEAFDDMRKALDAYDAKRNV